MPAHWDRRGTSYSFGPVLNTKISRRTDPAEADNHGLMLLPAPFAPEINRA
jgi:hypothetical protein